jgi:hypothetical protein
MSLAARRRYRPVRRATPAAVARVEWAWPLAELQRRGYSARTIDLAHARLVHEIDVLRLQFRARPEERRRREYLRGRANLT